MRWVRIESVQKVYLFCCLVVFLVTVCLLVYARADDIIEADRQALVEAQASGVSSKILAAREQLSDDQEKLAATKRQDLEGVAIPLTPDGQGHFLADVLINNRVHATLVVDTGSPVVMLTHAFLQKLDLDLSQSNTGYVEVLNGKYKAASVSLNTVALGGVQAHDVNAVVLLENNKFAGDGLLGLSFLSQFHFTLDQAGQKLILKKNA